MADNWQQSVDGTVDLYAPAMSTIPVDASIAPELIEFWARKYRETKDELDALKEDTTHDLVSKNDEILDVVRSIQRAVGGDAVTRQELDAVSKEKDQLAARLLQVEAERDALSTQVQMHTKQMRSLAVEAGRNRQSALALLFQPASFVSPYHQATIMLFSDFNRVLEHLPNIYASEQIQFISRPPSSLPLCIPVLGQHGYWFSATQGPFQLVVEGPQDEWTYLGKYISTPFLGHEMRLSEWLSLDQQTRLVHCSHVAACTAGSSTDQTVPAIKQRYDTGEWQIPCFSLQCVGYSQPLCQALVVSAFKVQRLASTRVDVARSTTVQVPQEAVKERVPEERSPKKARLSPKIMVKLEL